tara:strand:+ start:111 stop:4205 length:4095 start_codon:yes stop_codon:yes gene_type:complete
MTSKKILLLLSILFLWTCGGGGSKAPTEPVEPAPVSNFTATPTSGLQPLEVVFTSTATGTIASYAWNVDADTDIEGTAATFTHTYTDAGTYGVTLTVTGPGGSNPKTVADMITVTSAAPTPTTATTQTTQEEESITFTLSATDPNGQAVTFAIATQPSNGTASISNDQLTYTPNENFYGIDSVEYTVSNGNYTSNSAVINITVTGTDDGNPTTNNVSVETDEDVAIVIDLDASEIDGDNYSFAIISQPTNGTLGSISGNQVEYTPNQDWNGTDTFTFEATDDRFSRRNVATATITVNATNDAPQANDISVELDENRNSTHLLNENNDFIENEKAIISSIKISKNSITNTLEDHSFNKKTLEDNSLNNNSNNQFDGTKEGGSVNNRFKPVVITLDATDVEGDALSYYLVASASNGTIEGVSSNSVRYTPNQDFNGTDTFTYGANDGNLDSNVATVAITINAVNDAPVSDNVSTTMDEDIPLTGDLSNFISDIDGDNLTLIAVTNPANGSATFSGSELTYSPNEDYNGTDTFTYKVNDGELDSNTSTITITINPINDAPVAENITVSAYKNTAVEFDLVANDVDGDDIDWGFGALPSGGTLEWVDENNGTLRYTPNQDFTGTDTFEYYGGDPQVWSDVAIVTISVSNLAQPPAFINTSDLITVMGDNNREYINPGQGFSPDVMTYGAWRHVQSVNLSVTNPTKTYPNVNQNQYYQSVKVVPGSDGNNGTLTSFWYTAARGNVSETEETKNVVLKPWTKNNGIHLLENIDKEWYFYAKTCYEVYDGSTYHELTCSEPERIDVIFPHSFITSGAVENPWGTTDSRYHLISQDEGEDIVIQINNRAFTDPSLEVTVEIKRLNGTNDIPNVSCSGIPTCFENPGQTQTVASARYYPTSNITDLAITFPYNDEDVKKAQAYVLKFSYDGIPGIDIWGERFYVDSWRTANATVIIADPDEDQLWTLIDDFDINFEWDPGNAPYNSGPPNQLRMRIIEERNDGVAGTLVRYEEIFSYANSVSFDPSSNIDLQDALHSRNCQGQIAYYDEDDCWTTTMVFDSPDNDYRDFKTSSPDLDTSYMNIGVNGNGNYFYGNNGKYKFQDGMSGIRFEVGEGGIPSDASVVGRKFTLGQGTLLDTFSTIHGVALVHNGTNRYELFIPRHLDVENKTNGGTQISLPVNGNNNNNPGASKNFKEYNISVSVSDPDGLFTGEHIDTRRSSTDIFMVDEYNDDHIVTAGFCNLPGNGGPDNTVFIPGQRYNLCVSFGDAFYRPALRIVDTTNNDAVMWQKSYTYEEMINGEGAVPFSNIFQLYFTLPTDVFTEEQQHGKYRLELYDDYDSNPNLWGYGPKNNGSGVHTTGTTATTTDFVIRSSE